MSNHTAILTGKTLFGIACCPEMMSLCKPNGWGLLREGLTAGGAGGRNGRIAQFIRRAKKYPDLQGLTPTVLHDLVSKVSLCAPDKTIGHSVQDGRSRLAYTGFLPESILVGRMNHATENRTA